MKKGKKSIYIISSIILIAVISISMYSIWTNKKKGIEKEAVVTRFFEKYQKLDESCGECLLNNEEGIITFNGAQALFAKSLEYDIKNVKRNDEYSIVNVTVDNVDIIETLNQTLADNPEATDGMTEELITLLDSDTVPRKTFKVEVWVDNSSNKIRMTGDLANALLGGYHELINDLLDRGKLDEESN